MNPSLVLADEPTGNLDTQSADDVFDLLREVNRRQQTTFLIVTHDPRLAARCDRIIELVDGRIVADRPVTAAWGLLPGSRNFPENPNCCAGFWPNSGRSA